MITEAAIGTVLKNGPPPPAPQLGHQADAGRGDPTADRNTGR